MKKNKALFLALIIWGTLLTFISSCASNDNADVQPLPHAKSTFELLTSYNWVQTAFILDGVDKFNDIPNCEKDNLEKFLPNGDFIYDIGLAKCGTENQVRSIAKWELIDNETKINRSDGITVTIIELTNNKLITEEKRQNDVTVRYQYNALPTFSKMIVNSSKSWNLTGLTNNGIDAFNKLIECEKDNKFFFFTSGKYKLDEGATTCAQNGPQVMESTWLFADNETQIKIDNTFYTIKEIAPTKLVLELVADSKFYTYETK